MIAPSEKHLEDFLFSKPHIIFPIQTRVIARQYKLPSGIADMVLAHLQRLAVVELKKGAIDAITIAQCLRYMGDMQGILEGVLGRLYAQGSLNQGEFTAAFIRIPQYVQGVVIGKSFEDEKLITVCEAANICALTYDYLNDGTYSFEGLVDPSFRRHQPVYDVFAEPRLLLALKEYAFSFERFGT